MMNWGGIIFLISLYYSPFILYIIITSRISKERNKRQTEKKENPQVDPTGKPMLKYEPVDVYDYHENNFPGNGKIEIIAKTPVTNAMDLTLAYSPGVAVACK